MKGSGLVDSWIESGLLGPNAADTVMNGKAYKRAMHLHKITLQALWRMLVSLLLTFCKTINVDPALHISCLLSSAQNVNELITYLKLPQFQRVYNDFLAQKCQENVNFRFWWNYMETISTLLDFTRGQRKGDWELYLDSFRDMLPYFFRYDHLNYAKWGVGIYCRDGTTDA